MLINELRLGNWLQRLDGSFFQVTPTDFTLIPDRSEYLQPKRIPLTEEILIKAGFELRNNAHKSYQLLSFEGWKIVLRLRASSGPNWHLILTYDGESILLPKNIQYLHQLQNMVYCFRGEELTIDLR